MTTAKNQTFTNPKFFRSVDPSRLRRFLDPHRDYLSSRGLKLPTTGSLQPETIEQARQILSDPDDDTPSALIRDLHIANELSHAPTMERLLDEIESLSGRFRGDMDVTACDVAIEALLHHPEHAERLHRFSSLNRRRSFVYFQARSESPPRLPDDLGECCRRLEKKVNEYFHEKRWGLGTRIISQNQPHFLQLTIGHGLPRQLSEALVEGRFDFIDYRPVRDDLIYFNKLTGELKINAMTEPQRRMYRHTFGECFFDDADMFPEGEIWTAHPLIEHGRRSLTTADIHRLRSAELLSVKLDLDGEIPEIITDQRDELIDVLEERMNLFASENVIARIIEAKIALLIDDSRKVRMVTIKPPNVAQFNRDCDADVIEAFLFSRGFASGRAKPLATPGSVLGVGQIGPAVSNV